MLSRFEKENGGELLVAAVCLLEVSARGLLEIELLQILGDEDNLMPPPKTQNSKGQEKGISSLADIFLCEWNRLSLSTNISHIKTSLVSDS